MGLLWVPNQTNSYVWDKACEFLLNLKRDFYIIERKKGGILKALKPTFKVENEIH